MTDAEGKESQPEPNDTENEVIKEECFPLTGIWRECPPTFLASLFMQYLPTAGIGCLAYVLKRLIFS